VTFADDNKKATRDQMQLPLTKENDVEEAGRRNVNDSAPKIRELIAAARQA